MNTPKTEGFPFRVLSVVIVIILLSVLSGRLDVQPIKFGSNSGSGIVSSASSSSSSSSSTSSSSASQQKSGSSVSAAQPALIPHLDLRASLQSLDSEALENAEALYAAVASFSPSCKLPHPTTQDAASKLYQTLRMECPELFQLSNSYTLVGPLLGGNADVESISLQYAVSESDYKQQLATCEQAVEDISSSIAGLSEEVIERYCYDYIAAHCTYDKTAPHSDSPYGVFGDGRAKCIGISMAMKWLMESNGISCLVFSGNPRDSGEPHAWNSVCLNGQYYDVDVTPDVIHEGATIPTLYGAFNVSNTWVRGRYTLDDWCVDLSSQFGTDSMEESFHVKDATFIRSGSDWRLALQDQYSAATQSTRKFCVQFEDDADYAAAVASIADIVVEGFSSWRVDEYRTLHVSLS